MHHRGILCNVVSDQGTHFTAKDVRQWAHAHGTYWSFHVPTNLKQLVEWSSEDLVIASARWHTLLAWNKVCQKTVYALNQCPIYDVVSP